MRRKRRTMTWIFFTVVILAAVLLTSGARMSARLHAGEEKVSQLQKKIEEENARTEEIVRLQKKMKTDEYKKQVAKEKLGLIEDNEIIFKEAREDK